MTVAALPKVATAVSTVVRLLAIRDSTVQLSAPTNPPIDSAINTQPRCAGSLRSLKYLGNSTLSIGRYRPVTASSSSPSARNTRLFQTKRSPSTTPDTTPSGRSSGSGRSAPGRRSTAMARIERPKAPAVTHMVLIPPSVAMSRPPIPGPVM